MLAAVTVVVRAVQLLCAVLVLGLVFSWGPMSLWTSYLSYSLFVGVFSVLVGILGAVAICATFISPRFTMAGDALAAVLSLAGGIVWTVRTVSAGVCSSWSGPNVYVVAFCRRIHATQASMFSTFVMSSVLVWLGYQTLSKRKQASSV